MVGEPNRYREARHSTAEVLRFWTEYVRTGFTKRTVALFWVWIDPTVDRMRIAFIQSGVPVLFRGRHLIATAAHVCECPSELKGVAGLELVLGFGQRMIKKGEHGTELLGPPVFRRPPGHDVGLIPVLRPEILEAEGVVFTPVPEEVAAEDAVARSEVIVVGRPSAFTKARTHELDGRLYDRYGFDGMALHSRVVGTDDRGRIIVEYGGVLEGDIPVPDSVEGISGGGVWRINRIGESDLASLNAFRLLALQSAELQDPEAPRLFAEPMSRWLDLAEEHVAGDGGEIGFGLRPEVNPEDTGGDSSV